MNADPAGSALRAESRIIAALEGRGSQITSPRRELAALIARWEGSFSAKEVIARAPTASRPTTYRALKLFVDAGILCKTGLPDGSPRYSLDGPHHHHHLVCVPCGRIDEFRCPSVESMIRAIAARFGGILGHRLDLYHRCEECRRRERRS